MDPDPRTFPRAAYRTDETPKKVLLVEDDRTSRVALASGVEAMGHVVIQSSNGRDAISILDENPDIRLVITDVMMPEMDGREMVRILRGLERSASLPIILISGVVNRGDVVELLELGVTRFLKKPVHLSLLREFVEQLIGSPRQPLPGKSG